MREDEIAREQAHRSRRAIQKGRLGLEQVWWHYFSLGGEVGLLELEAYLHHAMSIPRLERDILAHAVNELLSFAPRIRVPYAFELDSAGGPAEDSGDGSGQET